MNPSNLQILTQWKFSSDSDCIHWPHMCIMKRYFMMRGYIAIMEWYSMIAIFEHIFVILTIFTV